MNDAAQNECKYFAIGTRVTLFRLNHVEFNIKSDVMKYPLE